MVNFTKIELEKKEQIAYLRLNNPAALNAIDMKMLLEMESAILDVKSDSNIQVLIISGNGPKGFTSGADIGYLRSLSPTEFNEFNDYACNVLTLLEEMGKISIAALHGYAVGGGCELAESCTLRVAEEGTLMGQPEINIAGVAGWGGTTRLPRLIGFGKAVELLLSGKFITADEALEIGLINRIAPKGQLFETTNAFASEFLSKSPQAVKYSLDAIYRGIEMHKRDSLKIGAKNSALMRSTSDFLESTNKFDTKIKKA